MCSVREAEGALRDARRPGHIARVLRRAHETAPQEGVLQPALRGHVEDGGVDPGVWNKKNVEEFFFFFFCGRKKNGFKSMVKKTGEWTQVE